MKTTKELAGELGLIRKRKLKEGVGGMKENATSAQHFAYLVVIDFESTCWKDKKNPNQEIIEFPAVLLNTSTGETEDEFHTYCLPEEYPRLSAFCTELTGITQEQVESGIPLFLCLKKFSRWLKKLETEKAIAYNSSSDANAKLCTFVTWSDWDLGVCLHYECQRKQLMKPEALKCWIDLRATYRKFYQRVPNGLEGALKDLGIQFKGRQHSGLDDARNTAHLAWRMICDGCQMKITKSMSSSGTKPLNLNSAAVGTYQKQHNSSAATSTSNSNGPAKQICQFSNSRRKMSASTSAHTLQSLSASPELCNRSKSIDSKAAIIGCMGNSSNFGCSGGIHPVSSAFKTPDCCVRTPNGSEIVSEGSSKGSISTGVCKTPGLVKSRENKSTDTGKSVQPCKRKMQGAETPSTRKTFCNSMFKTPEQSIKIVKITPPLCNCGKRSRKRNVFSPGPNQGRTYYSCGHRRRGKLQDVTNFIGGCNFFKWESVLIKGMQTPSTSFQGSASI